MNQYQEWAEKARSGDAHAFALLYEKVYRDMYRFALYTLRNETDAEDAVSEAVADAYASIRKLRSAEAFKSWIFRILYHKCKDRLKEYTRKHLSLEELESEPGAEQEADEHYAVRKVFGELPDTDRLIISMHVFGGYTGREIAAILKMNPNTVRTRESRALKKLAEELENRYGYRSDDL